MSILLLLFPLMSAISVGFLGFLIGRAGAFILSNVLLFFAVVLSLVVGYDVICCGNIQYIKLGH
jgi:hypothetical protein